MVTIHPILPVMYMSMTRRFWRAFMITVIILTVAVVGLAAICDAVLPSLAFIRFADTVAAA